MDKKKTKTSQKSNRIKHGTASTIFTVLFIALVILFNMLFSTLETRFPSLKIDMTKENLNTLSDDSMEEIDKIDKDTKVYIIGSEDTIRADTLYANYGVQYSQVPNLLEKMHEKNSKISFEFVDPDKNPAFISQYSDLSLTTGKVLVVANNHTKVLAASDMFNITSNQQTGEQESYSMVDGALTNAIHVVNMDTIPVIAVATGHDEIITSDYRKTFDSIMKDNSFEVKEFSPLTDDIPENANMVFIGGPTKDYSSDEITKLRNFINDQNAGTSRNIFITCNPSQPDMPNLSEFMAEWGLKVDTSVTVLESDKNKTMSNNPALVISEQATENMPKGTYNNLLSIAAAPIDILFKSNNDIATYPLIKTSDAAYVSESAEDNPTDKSSQVTAAMATKSIGNSSDGNNASMVVFGSSYSFISNYLSTDVIGNKSFITDVAKLVTGTSDSQNSLYIKQTQTNQMDITASSGLINFLGLTLFTVIIPVILVLIGVIVFFRRRHL